MGQLTSMVCLAVLTTTSFFFLHCGLRQTDNNLQQFSSNRNRNLATAHAFKTVKWSYFILQSSSHLLACYKKN